MSIDNRPRRSRWVRRVRGLFGLLLSTAGVYAIILAIASTIRAGDGGKLYQTGWGYKTSAYGKVAVFAALVLGAIIAVVLGWFRRREERAFLRKYGPRE